MSRTLRRLFGGLAEVEQTPLRARWQHGAAGSRQNHFQEARRSVRLSPGHAMNSRSKTCTSTICVTREQAACSGQDSRADLIRSAYGPAPKAAKHHCECRESDTKRQY